MVLAILHPMWDYDEKDFDIGLALAILADISADIPKCPICKKNSYVSYDDSQLFALKGISVCYCMLCGSRWIEDKDKTPKTTDMCPICDKNDFVEENNKSILYTKKLEQNELVGWYCRFCKFKWISKKKVKM